MLFMMVVREQQYAKSAVQKSVTETLQLHPSLQNSQRKLSNAM